MFSRHERYRYKLRQVAMLGFRYRQKRVKMGSLPTLVPVAAFVEMGSQQTFSARCTNGRSPPFPETTGLQRDIEQ